MRKPFKLTGNIEAKFKQLETIVPRLVQRMNNKVYVPNPDSVLTHYCQAPDEDGLLLKCCLFAGKVKKIWFTIGELEGKEAASYVCFVGNERKQQQIQALSKKRSGLIEANVEVEDGDFVMVKQTNPNVTLKDITLAVLVELERGNRNLKEFALDELEKEFAELPEPEEL